MSEQLIKTPGVFGDNGNFLLERELGSGGMGGVYLGRDKMLDRPVAVKVMLKEFGSDPEFVEKFKKEAQAAARLVHPNIVQVYSYGICEGMPYMALELASGGSLYALMNANPGKVDIQRALKICQQTAQALQCATDQGFVHGDVKPENILLDSNGNAKLVDFGLAAMQKDTDEIWGTPYYISPEKVRKEPVDFRADMYSLGGTLYHALTGVAPFEGEDAIAVVKKRFEGMPKKPSEIRPEVTPAVDELVMKMLALAKEDRYPSFEALLEAFKEVLTSGLTQKAQRPQGVTKTAAGSATGVRRTTTMRTRRMTTMKKPTVGGVSPETEASEDSKAASDENDEDEEGGNLGVKVLLFVVGGLLAIGAVVGGLVWFKVATKNAEAAEAQAQIVSKISQARSAIANTRESTIKFEADFQKFAAEATTRCERFTTEIAGLLPNYANKLKPAPTKELLDAQALLAGPKEEPPAPPPAPAATTNNTPAATQTAPAPQPAPAPEAEPKQEAATEEQPPSAVTDVADLWERAYKCQACQIRISIAAKKVLAECDKAEAIKGSDSAAMTQLAELSQSAKELHDLVTGSPDVATVKKELGLIKDKGERMLKKTLRELKIKKAENERAAAAAAAADAEKERQQKLEEEKKALVEKETSEIAEKFDAITAQGCFRLLDWASATRQLTQCSEEFKTPEGELAAKFQLKKVEQMKKVHETFIKHLKGYQFSSKNKKMKGWKVTSVSEKELTFLKPDKKTVKIFWQKFYKDYPGSFNEIINVFIVDGRKNSGIRTMDWKDAMVGAALTMRLVCSEVQGATVKAEWLAKEVVRQYPDFENQMKEIFPDIDFSGVANQE